MTPKESQAALAWLNERWTIKVCPFHGPTNWEVGEVMIQTLPYIGGGVSIGGPTYPLLVVTCSQCGYTVLVNAIKAGIVEAPPPVPTPSPPATGSG
jgi:predicted nucleic-acid-binding Zn-ribbon protein